MSALDRVAGQLGYRTAGDGTPVLFLHGLGGSRTAWEPQLASLSDDFRCIAWDMPGYGVSAPLPEPLTFEAIADAAARLFDDLDIERAHVVGLSFGGQQALHLALRHPERVHRLVLVDTSAVFGADGTDVEEWKQLRLAPLDDGLTPYDMAPQLIDAITADGFDGPERKRTIDAFARISSRGLRAAVECLPSHDVIARLGDIAAPSLVIVGELDDETPLAYADALFDGPERPSCGSSPASDISRRPRRPTSSMRSCADSCRRRADHRTSGQSGYQARFNIA